MRFPLRGKRRHRRDADFDAAVALIIGLAAFGRAFQLRFAITQRRHPRALDAAAGEIVGDRGGAAFGQALVIGFAAGRIGVAIDVDIGARIFGERRGDIVERAAELRFHERAVIVESDVAGHVEHELVALALDVDAGARGAFAQLLFLLVHIIADARAGDRADARADDLFGAVAAPADQVAEQIAAERAADAADRGLGNLAFAGHRIGDAAGQRDRAETGQNCEPGRPAFHHVAPLFGRMPLVLCTPLLADNIWWAFWFQNMTEWRLSRAFSVAPLCSAAPFAYREP